jgi:hypothetical protein
VPRSLVGKRTRRHHDACVEFAARHPGEIDSQACVFVARYPPAHAAVDAHLINGIVYVDCQAIYDQRADQGDREAAEAIEAVLGGEPLPHQELDWVISWSTWDVV